MPEAAAAPDATAAIHGSQLRTGLLLQLNPPDYDSAATTRINVTLTCSAAACAAAQNGFLLVPRDESGAPTGTLQPATPGWSQPLPTCGGLTHTAAMAATTWSFTWTSARGAPGTVTFLAAVAASYDATFVTSACLSDAGAGAGSDASMAGMQMRRLQHAAAPSTGQLTCPSSQRAASAGMAAMGGMGTVFSIQATGWGDLLFPGASVSSPPRLAAAIILAGLFAAATTMVAALLAPMELRATTIAVTPGQALCGAAAAVLRSGCHYGSMLLVMSFNVWIILGVLGGHGVGVLLLALLRRAALLPSWSKGVKLEAAPLPGAQRGLQLTALCAVHSAEAGDGSTGSEEGKGEAIAPQQV